MISILILDDTDTKVAKIISAIKELGIDVYIDSAIDMVGGRKLLSEKKFDLLILDAMLPERKGGEKNENAGVILLQEIEIKRKLINPSHIIGLTQHENLVESFDDIWLSIHYDTQSDVWKELLKRKIKYISIASEYTSQVESFKSTIFVEGLTDVRIYRDCMQLYYPEYEDKIDIVSEKNAGSSWVARKLVAWANNMPKIEGEPVFAVGIFDFDDAGKKAIIELNRAVPPGKGEKSKMTRAIKLEYKHAPILLEIVRKGINLPITLEEMFPVEMWKHANESDWLESRGNLIECVVDKGKYNPMKHGLLEFYEENGITDDELVYIQKKCKSEYKNKFTKYFLDMGVEKRKELLLQHSLILKDSIDFLKIDR